MLTTLLWLATQQPSSAADSDDTVLIEPRVAGGPGDPLPQGLSIGRYVVLSRAGKSGMGEVYCAHDPDLDRKVAFKLLSPKGSSWRASC